MKRYVRWAGNAVVAILLVAMGVLVFFTISSRLSSDGIAKVADTRLMVVLSGSMKPAFNEGDVIVVSGNQGNSSYQKGQVITFKDPEDAKRIITHRVVEVIKGQKGVSYRTKGDANSAVDVRPVPAGNVIGAQKWRIPYFGRVVEFSKTKQGFIWLIVVPGLVIILSELKSIGRAVTEEIERKKREAVAEQCTEGTEKQ